jgi:hypothetical protein
MSRDFRNCFLCAALATAAILLTHPFVEMGFNDDFSYTQIALRLAQTGKLIYNGWNTPMLGFQAYWAALFIKGFGFSFTLVRFSTLPFVAGASILLYLIAVYAGVSRNVALIYSCFVILSPLSLPLAASFMTDLPSLFFLLMAFMAALKATDQHSTPSASAVWIALVAITGLIGGSIRQAVWLAPAIFLPYIAYSLGKRWSWAWCGVNWCVVVLLAAKMLHWFNAQPYSTAMPLLPSWSAGLRGFITNTAGLGLEYLILLMPVTALLWRPRSLSRGKNALVICAAALISAVAVWAPRIHRGVFSMPFEYFAANIVTDTGIFLSGVEALGTKPATLSPALQLMLLTSAIFMALSALLTRLAGFRPGGISGLAVRARSNAAITMQLGFLFSLMYASLLISRAAEGLAIDRYLIPLLAFGGLLCLIRLPAPARTSTIMSVAVTVLFAGYAIATTHDYFAGTQARLEATQYLTGSHVPRQNITAGSESDGWVQLNLAGYVNDSRITIPPNAYKPYERISPVVPEYWFWNETPAIQPIYYLVLSPQSVLTTLRDVSVTYTAWIPPFKREIYIQYDPRALKESTLGDRSPSADNRQETLQNEKAASN